MSVRTSNASETSAARPARIRDRIERGASLESMLWTVAVAGMLLDVGLTAYGLGMGLTEVNPLGRIAVSTFGTGGLLLAKLPVVAIAVVGWRFVPDGERWAVPLGLAIPWGLAVLLNTSVLLSSV